MKNRGITLVALVVTIIILLILAGITISQLNENSLFENAKLSEEKYDNSQKEEEIKISEATNIVSEYLAGTTRNSLTEQQIRAIVQDEISNSLNKIVLDYTNKVDIKSYNSSSNKYTVPSIGIVTATSSIGSTGKMNKIYINQNWYYISGGSNGGFVNGSAYSQFVNTGDTIYFVTDGNVSYTPDVAYFIPFKYAE